ncbi:MAG: right-handed parallel beta-helix repeat-containing protein [Acidobacteriota bacterium]
MAAQSGELAIAGMVSQDRLVLSVRPHFLAAEGVTLKLYGDDGDRTPSAGDRLLATTKSDKAGMYVFRVDAPGAYWVTVDSRSFFAGAWPEQTFGPAGSLCAHPEEGTHALTYEGSCFGGRTAGGSDDASSLMTSEHLALINVRESITNADFAFSFDAVTNTLDGDGIQGSLRQYFVNANTVKGINRMRFVPIERGTAQRDLNYGVPPQWWTITFKTPLPELTDEDTLVDGTPYNFVAPSSVLDLNPGRFGESVTLESGEPDLSRLKKPELELITTGASGIVCAASCGLRGFALHGTQAGIVARADVRVEHVLVGATPAGDAAPGVGEVGVQIERGTFTARHLLVMAQANLGVSVAPEGKLDGEHLEVSRCGQPLRGAGIALLSSGSSIRSSQVTANPGAGIVLGSTDGKAPATGNTIDRTTISGNQAGVILGPGSSRNVITRNDIMWNRLGGVTVTPFENLPPRENRISANRFDENGLRPIILDLNVDDPNLLSRGTDTCTVSTTVPNAGISSPRVTDVNISEEGGLRARIRGRACPGQVVELYQSFVTSSISQNNTDMPEVRDDDIENETITTQERVMTIPSIGEFNYLGATTANADGTFEATFPLKSVKHENMDSKSIEETKIWASQVLTSAAAPSDRAFSAIAIDAAGNTSEMSVRRKE